MPIVSSHALFAYVLLTGDVSLDSFWQHQPRHWCVLMCTLAQRHQRNTHLLGQSQVSKTRILLNVHYWMFLPLKRCSTTFDGLFSLVKASVLVRLWLEDTLSCFQILILLAEQTVKARARGDNCGRICSSNPWLF